MVVVVVVCLFESKSTDIFVCLSPKAQTCLFESKSTDSFVCLSPKAQTRLFESKSTDRSETRRATVKAKEACSHTEG